MDNAGEKFYTSRQVIREFIAAVTRNMDWHPALTMESALVGANELKSRCAILEDGPDVFEHLMSLCANVSFPGRDIHDANIVATMLAHGEKKLFTFNFRDFRRFDKYIELVDIESVQ